VRSFRWSVALYALTVLCGLIAILTVLCNLGTPAVDGVFPDSLTVVVFETDMPDPNRWTREPWNLVVLGAGVVAYRDSMPSVAHDPSYFLIDGPDTLFIVSSWDSARVR